MLDALTEDADPDVATLADVRSGCWSARPSPCWPNARNLRDPRLTALAAHDNHLAPSLLAYLDAFGDVRTAAGRLHVHPNTLRYRVRRAAELTGIDLDDPLVRLFAGLQLRLPVSG